MKRKILILAADSTVGSDQQAVWHGWTKLHGVLLAVVELDNGEMKYIDPTGIKFIDGPAPSQQAAA